MEHFCSSSAVQGTYEGMSGGTEVHPSSREDKEEPPSAEKQSNAEEALPSQHRRTRSMSLPNSPSILTVPRVSPICNLLALSHLDRFLRSCDYKSNFVFTCLDPLVRMDWARHQVMKGRYMEQSSIALVTLMHH
jgi:hypothetical protein